MTPPKPAVSTDPMTSDDVIKLPPPAPATVLRQVGVDTEPFDLTKYGDRFTVGRVPRKTDPPARADVRLPSTQVSLVHAEVSRRGSSWRVRDLGSSNGTYNDDGEDIKDETPMVPGRMLRFGDLRVLPLNPAQCELRERLRWCMGLDEHLAVDEALNEISHNRAVSLIGPAGCEQENLAREIHAASTRAAFSFHVVPDRATSYKQLAEHRGGTVFLDLTAVQRRHIVGPFVKALLGVGRQRPLYLRPIIAARHEREVRRLFLAHTPLMLPTLTLPSLKQRREDIPRLLDQLLRRGGRRFGEIDPDAARALAGRDWRNNLDDLRRAAEILGAWLAERSGRRAAAKVGLSHEAVNKFLRGLFRDDEDADE
jgi:hypothetical protein